MVLITRPTFAKENASLVTLTFVNENCGSMSFAFESSHLQEINIVFMTLGNENVDLVALVFVRKKYKCATLASAKKIQVSFNNFVVHNFDSPFKVRF